MLHNFNAGVGTLHAEVIGQLVYAQLTAVVHVVNDLLGCSNDHAAGANRTALRRAQVGEVQAAFQRN